MSYADAIHDRLADIPALVADLTGGILHFRDMPAEVNINTLPGVYDDDDVTLLPFMVVRGRDMVPFGPLRDGTYRSMSQVVELYFYDDAAAGWETIAEAADEAYRALQGQPPEGAFDLELTNEINDTREPNMENACMLRHDYRVIGRKT